MNQKNIFNKSNSTWRSGSRVNRLSGGTLGTAPKPHARKSVKHGYVDNVLSTPTDANVQGRLNRSSHGRRGGQVSKTVHASSGTSVGSGEKVGRGGLKNLQRKSIAKMILISLLCLVVVVAIGFGVAAMVFMHNLDTKLELRENQGTEPAAESVSVADVLAAAADGKPYYALIAADLDGLGAAGLGDGPDAIMLMYVDPSAQKLTFLSVPADAQVSLKDGRTHQLRNAYTQDGTAAFIQDVSSLVGVNIAHFAYLDANGLVSLVDDLGGISVNLAEEVDDPTAGDVYIAAGQQELTGSQAVLVARASNYVGGRTTQAKNRAAIMKGIAAKLVGNSDIDFYLNLDKLGAGIGCDVSATGACALFSAMRGCDDANMQVASLPGYESSDTETTYVILSTSSVSSMLERVEAGETPEEVEEHVSVDPQSFTITVRNGGGVTGAASSVAGTLQAQNYKVEETGNTDTQVYNDTLVIYNDGAFADAAQAVVDELGIGRTVQSNGTYSFETDVLVIVGKDFATVN